MSTYGIYTKKEGVEEEITGTVKRIFSSLSTGVTFIYGPIMGVVISLVGYLNSYFILFIPNTILSGFMLLFMRAV